MFGIFPWKIRCRCSSRGPGTGYPSLLFSQAAEAHPVNRPIVVITEVIVSSRRTSVLRWSARGKDLAGPGQGAWESRRLAGALLLHTVRRM